ncbi:MAG TPA: peroxiredoxin [Candidatus Baltobacteraceae bacterium]
MLGAGDHVPDVSVKNEAGEDISLGSLVNSRTVVYFYPKADTPGCTNESQQFRDLYAKFRKKETEVVGVSRDAVPSQKKFKDKYGLPFHLLADTDSNICNAFGVIVEKNMYGKKSMGIQRSTFLIDNGKIVRVWPKVVVEGHAAEVLSSLS